MKNLPMKNRLFLLLVICLTTITVTYPVMAAAPTSDCPERFAKISIHTQASLCQIFDANKSSSSQSMSYFVPVAPQQLIAFYLTEHPQFSIHSEVNQRTLLTVLDGKTRVAIAQDNGGSQVDILAL